MHDVGVEFPGDVHELLTGDFHVGSHRYLARRVAETLAILADLNVPKQSELTHLYVNYGPQAVWGGAELNSIDDVVSWTEYALDELEVADQFVALSSIEGQGIVLYDRLSGAVYDVEYGQFEALASGTLAPKGDSVSDFVRWCAKQRPLVEEDI